jgi:hypothetical protein
MRLTPAVRGFGGELVEVTRAAIMLWPATECDTPVELWARSGQCFWRGMDAYERRLVPAGVQVPTGERP